MIRAVIFDCFGVLCQSSGKCNDPVVELARSLRGRYKIAMLSNISRSFIDQLFSPKELDDLFNAVVLSGELGIAKPMQEVYDLTAQRLGVMPEECVMIDDSEINIEGARRSGMQGVVFETPQQCQLELSRLLEREDA